MENFMIRLSVCLKMINIGPTSTKDWSVIVMAFNGYPMEQIINIMIAYILKWHSLYTPKACDKIFIWQTE
jgi:hypothetical protein